MIRFQSSCLVTFGSPSEAAAFVSAAENQRILLDNVHVSAQLIIEADNTSWPDFRVYLRFDFELLQKNNWMGGVFGVTFLILIFRENNFKIA